MAYSVWKYSDDKMVDITPIISDMNLRSSTEELGDEFNFSVTANDNKYFPINPLNVGDLIVFLNSGVELFRGTIITENREGRFKREYNCFDPAFYLNKSEVKIQFNKIRADKAIELLLNKLNVPIGNIASNGTIINKLHKDTGSAILKDILQETQNQLNKKYRFEMRKGKLYVEKQESLFVTGTFKLSFNLQAENITSIIGNPTRKISISEMRNSIVITHDSKKNKALVEVKNTNLINKYGLLQLVETIDKTDIAYAKNIANNKLSELAKVFEENSVELFGHDSFRAGYLVTLEEPVTGMSGNYLIKEANHTYANGIHRMTLNLGVV